jgi:hypothetical protein
MRFKFGRALAVQSDGGEVFRIPKSFVSFRRTQRKRAVRLSQRRRNVRRNMGPRIQSEVKSLTTSVSQGCDTTGAVTLLDGMVQGTSAITRVGRQIVVRSVELSLAMHVTPTTGLDQIDRFLLIYDRQSNGVAPTIQDVLESNSVFALPNKNNALRFVILMDVVKAVNASTESDSDVVTGRVVRRCNKLVQFNSGNAGTVADIATGGMFLITMGTLDAGVTAGSLIGRVRVNFTDS